MARQRFRRTGEDRMGDIPKHSQTNPRQRGFLTRDAHAKERKKPGLKRARKAPPYTKR